MVLETRTLATDHHKVKAYSFEASSSCLQTGLDGREPSIESSSCFIPMLELQAISRHVQLGLKDRAYGDVSSSEGVKIHSSGRPWHPFTMMTALRMLSPTVRGSNVCT